MPRSAGSKNLDVLQIKEDFLEGYDKAFRKLELPDIVTFAENEYFCGKKLFPRQKTILRLIYGDIEHMTDYDYEVINEWKDGFYYGTDRIGVSPDVWKRVGWLREHDYPHFREVEFIGGRRGGKGHLGGIMGAYQALKLIYLDNPQWHYGIDLTHDLYCFITATNQQQARDYQFKDLADTITGARCFENYISNNKSLWISLRTPADIRRIANYERRKVNIEREIASVRFVALSSNSRAGRGAATFMLAFDEMAHMQTGTEGPQTAEEVYKALTPSLDQMGSDAFIYIPSSPYSKVGAAYEIYEDALAVKENGEPLNPDLLMIQLPSWEPYKDWDDPKVIAVGTFRSAPQVLDEQAKRLEERDPEAFKVERRAQWAEVINAYLNPKIVERMFAEITYDNGETRVLQNGTEGVMRWIYRGHADPSDSQANFAMAIGHTEPITDLESGEVYHHVFFDWLNVWKPQDFPDHQVDYIQIEEEIVETIMKFRSLRMFSYDQYGGFIAVPYLKKHLREQRHQARVKESPFTQQSNQKRAERFKSALGMNWIHAPRDNFFHDGSSLLEQELKFLQVKNGRVAKQNIGPVTTKDLSDSLHSSCEVMTLDGWKSVADVTVEDFVATRTVNGEIEYQHPTGTLKRRVDPGEGLYILDTDRLSFAVTPRHRMMVEPLAGGMSFYENMEDIQAKRAIPKTALAPTFSDQWIDLARRIPNPLGRLEIPVGMCQCGCGMQTRLAKRTRSERGDIKGQPMRFVAGHHRVRWTLDEDQYLRDHYRSTPMADLVAVLDKDRNAIYNHARELERGQIGDRWKDRPESLPKTRLEDFAGFVGIWLAEGTKIVPGKQGYAVRLTQTKPKGIEWIDALFERLGWPHQRTLCSNGEIAWVVKSRELQSYLYALQDGHELRIPMNALCEWGRDALRTLLDGLLMGDGHWSNQVERFVGYSSSSRLLVDDVQRLLAHLGLHGRVKKVRDKGTRVNFPTGDYYSNYDQWFVSVCVGQRSRLDPQKVSKVTYDGYVYCISVPNTNFYIRRNGVPMWIGNCVMEVSSELLADQIERLARNELLGSTRLAYGAPGGYHTNYDGESTMAGSSRDKLHRFGNERYLQRPYGQGGKK